jgi:hypothetical protein
MNEISAWDNCYFSLKFNKIQQIICKFGVQNFFLKIIHNVQIQTS